jgi:hypothetical protein
MRGSSNVHKKKIPKNHPFKKITGEEHARSGKQREKRGWEM